MNESRAERVRRAQFEGIWAGLCPRIPPGMVLTDVPDGVMVLDLTTGGQTLLSGPCLDTADDYVGVIACCDIVRLRSLYRPALR